MTTEAAACTYDDLLVRAERDMFQEGYQLATAGPEWSSEEETGQTATTWGPSPYRRRHAKTLVPIRPR